SQACPLIPLITRAARRPSRGARLAKRAVAEAAHRLWHGRGLVPFAASRRDDALGTSSGVAAQRRDQARTSDLSSAYRRWSCHNPLMQRYSRANPSRVKPVFSKSFTEAVLVGMQAASMRCSRSELNANGMRARTPAVIRPCRA